MPQDSHQERPPPSHPLDDAHESEDLDEMQLLKADTVATRAQSPTWTNRPEPLPSSAPQSENNETGDAHAKEDEYLIGGMLPMQFAMMTMILANEAIGTTMLFPYVGLLVARVDGSHDRSAAGYYSGLLVGMFQLGQMLFSARWGHVSDRIGRKPVLALGSLCGGLLSIGFGLSTKLWMLLLFRLLHGVTCGNGAVGKTYTAEAVRAAHRTKAFGAISQSWAVGSLIGPTIGGFLYDPCTSSALSKLSLFSSCDGLFGRHPALLPSLMLSAYSLTTAALVLVYLPETNERAVPIRQWLEMFALQWKMPAWLARVSCIAGAWRVRGEGGGEFAPLPADDAEGSPGGSPSFRRAPDGPLGCATDSEDTEEEAEAREILQHPTVGGFGAAVVVASSALSHHHHHHLHDHDESPVEMQLVQPSAGADALEPDDMETLGDRSDADELDGVESEKQVAAGPARKALLGPCPPTGDTEQTAAAPGAPSTAEFGWGELLLHPVLSRVVPMYMTLCAYNISYAEVMPLYAIAFVKDGGLELSSPQIGIIFAANAVMSVAVNYFFSYATDRVRHLRLYRGCCLLYACTIPLVGASSLLSRWSDRSALVVVGVLVLISAVRVTVSGFQFSLCMLFVANAAPKHHLGRVTGMSHASGSVARCLAPIVAAPLFAWSISNGDAHVFPFDHNLLFFMCSAAAMAGYFLSTRLTENDVTFAHTPS
jgi:MFS family permease